MTERVSRILEELRSRLEELYGDRLEQVVLFGSHARDDATPESDVDVLVVLRGEVRPWEEIQRTSEIVGELSLRSGLDIARVFTSAERYRKEQSPFLLNVRREGVAV
ncbi:MAG TPA: nucleotidyltransferase domain-containing protein [Longimicrobiaceae bacterium]|nr:nucleotidyltransferase domain-containing protein [Longimicrobiaceae bacterium]